MPEKVTKAPPKGYTTLSGKCPQSGTTIDFLLSLKQFKTVQRYMPYWKVMAVKSIPEVLSAPTAYLKNLQREGFDDAFCVAGRPSSYYRAPDIETPFPHEMLLCVIVSWDDRGWIILDWEKRPEDPQLRGVPENGQRDFGELIWTAN
tara:strand:- start:2185 stop:2625 length:441 start_codon:yes stop_codon:yes gene_type:complete